MTRLTRRDILGSAAAVGGWLLLGVDPSDAQVPPVGDADGDQDAGRSGGPYQLPALPYGYADLEPFIDAQTMKLHHDRHHAGYVRGANEATAALERVRRVGGQQIHTVRAVTDALAFHTSGHLLHSLFWTGMKKGGGGDPPASGDIGRMITRDFGTIEAFRAQFAAAAKQVQGSGWSVLAFEPVSQRLLVLQAEKHQNLAVWGCVPLLVIDVWEHAYYLKYQSERVAYIKAFMNVINWESVQQQLDRALRLV